MPYHNSELLMTLQQKKLELRQLQIKLAKEQLQTLLPYQLAIVDLDEARLTEVYAISGVKPLPESRKRVFREQRAALRAKAK